jgi:hypothetical protein
MFAFTVRNVNHALPAALALLRDTGKRIAPRGQETLEMPGPVATTYLHPEEMVLFDPMRDANPFFHFFEALWILQGRQDVAFLAWLLPRMAEFSDNGSTFNAPYGHRLRWTYGFDQIEMALGKLAADPDSRQAVLSIWHPNIDWDRTVDVPCNDMVMLKVRDGALRMTVCNRSNDVVWGAYGANVVQFSSLLCYMAARLGVNVGSYTQISDSFHVYTNNEYWLKWYDLHRQGVPPVEDPYEERIALDAGAVAAPSSAYMGANGGVFTGHFDQDLRSFFNSWDEDQVTGRALRHPSDTDTWNTVYDSLSFQTVVLPMYKALTLWKKGFTDEALEAAGSVASHDWRYAVQCWMNRRIVARGAKAAA